MKSDLAPAATMMMSCKWNGHRVAIACVALCLVISGISPSSSPCKEAQDGKACASKTKRAREKPPKSIGVATMESDGTITLRLRSEGPAVTGEASMTYTKDNPEYAKVLKHIGRLHPGDMKPVRPWPKKEKK